MIWTTRAAQSRRKRVAFVECDMCFKIEPVPMIGRRLTAKLMQKAGWYINGLSVVCPQCIAQLTQEKP